MQERQKIHESRHIGDHVADRVAAIVGSWHFIIIQSVLLALWIAINSIALFMHWDGYPYVLLNLCLSFQAAFTAPIIMISQNRQAAKDKARDDVESKEVQAMFDGHEKILDIAEQILEILKNERQ